MGCTVGEMGISGARFQQSYRRAKPLRELLADTPSERMHIFEKLEKLDRKSDGSFELRLCVS